MFGDFLATPAGPPAGSAVAAAGTGCPPGPSRPLLDERGRVWSRRPPQPLQAVAEASPLPAERRRQPAHVARGDLPSPVGSDPDAHAPAPPGHFSPPQHRRRLLPLSPPPEPWYRNRQQQEQ